MRLIAPSEYRRMPWRNGGGTTFEVAVSPPGADWGSFSWRVSIAEIAAGGPFSSFPGIDRVLVMLAGRGMVLTGIGETPAAMAPYDCVAFPGEAQVESRLVDGPTRDLNVMTRRGVARAEVRVVRGARLGMESAEAYVCHAAAGTCACCIDGTTVEVPQGHTLVADAGCIGIDAPRDAVAIVAAVTA